MPEPTDSHAAQKMAVARADLFLTHPYWGHLVAPMERIEDREIEKACTDGKAIYYNPDYINSLSLSALKGLWAEEVTHCANGHLWRREGRDMQLWNEACDYSISPILKACGMDIADMIYDPDYEGLSPEAIFPILKEKQKQQQGGDKPGDGQGEGKEPYKPGAGTGDFTDPQPGEGEEETDSSGMEEEWKQRAIQAAQLAKSQGMLPSGIDRLLKEIRQPACHNLIAALLEWASRAATDNYTMRIPNRKYMQQGLYLPSLYSEDVPPIYFAVDTSGSIDGDTLQAYIGALQTVLNAVNPESMTGYSCDASIHAKREYLPGDEIDSAWPGGGGTDFRPVFADIAETDAELSGLIYLTDLQGTFPDNPPDYPVLWVVRDKYSQRLEVPFGEVIYLP
jgi:predicted metal-dependent peptidase